MTGISIQSQLLTWRKIPNELSILHIRHLIVGGMNSNSSSNMDISSIRHDDEEKSIDDRRASNIIRNNNWSIEFDRVHPPINTTNTTRKRHLDAKESSFVCKLSCEWVPQSMLDTTRQKSSAAQIRGHQSQCTFHQTWLLSNTVAGSTRRSLGSSISNTVDVDSSSNNSNSRTEPTTVVPFDHCDDHHIDNEFRSDEDQLQIYNSDNDSESTTAMGNQDESIDPNLPSMFILKYQQKLEESLAKPKLINIRRAKIKQNVEHIKPDDYIRLASLGVLFGISEKNGDEFLKKIQEIITNNGSNIELPLTWRSVNRGCDKEARKQSTINLISTPLNPDIWGSNSINLLSGNRVPLKQSSSWAFNILEVIGERFLGADPKYCFWFPDYNNLNLDVDENNETRHKRTYDSFIQSNMCHLIYEGIKRIHGETSPSPFGPEYPPVRNVAVCLGYSEDEAGVNSAKNKSIEPGVIDIINFHSKDKDNTNKGNIFI